VRDFSEDNPARWSPCSAFANVLGPHLTTPISRNLSRPLCPSIFGFDPLLQFVEEDDVVRALLHVTRGGIPGLYNVAGDGRLPWSEVASICGTHLIPLSPLQPVEDPPALAAVRPPARAGGPPALRPWASTPAARRHRIRVPRHQCRCRVQLHPRPPAAPAAGKPFLVVHLRARRRAVLPPLARRWWATRIAESIRRAANPAPAPVRAPPTPRT
jgi:hypothetical protein